MSENIETLKEEHTEELAVLSSSFSQHFDTKDDNNNDEKIKAYERDIKKLKNSIEDKNYHINQLQKRLMKTQVEMEKDLENHEAELENLRSQLEKLENSDTESLIELRMNELKEMYEKEISELKARLEVEESSHNNAQTKDEQLNNTMKEIDELKTKLKTLEDTMDERLEGEEMKFRREVMSVKDKLIHQHQLEIDELLSQLERSNAEVEKLRRLSRQSDHDERFGNHVANGEIAGRTESFNGIQDSDDDSKHFELMPYQIEGTETKMVQELEIIHAHYKHQFEFMNNRIKEQYRQDFDENVQKAEEDSEHQLEKQRNEYEEKIVGIQRQLRAQFQSDLERVTNDMEEQIQVLKDGHSEEIADLMQRVRGLSDERRRSYIEQDNNQQHVIVIKEEFKSKMDSLEQELKAEKEKVAQYEAQLQGVDNQFQAFKAEKEQEVKYIEEELKKQCKVLVEKKTKEVKERYQSELNEKVNKVEKTLRKQFDEESVRTRSELDESHRTLKEKYDYELSEMMVQMEQVQQRNQEVFEAQQKEQFEKQLSIVKEQLEPFKDKCQHLEDENKALLEKYNKDLSKLKLKMDEVEKRYSNTEKIEQESLRTLEDELSLYKGKVKELEEGNEMLIKNYGAQVENIKKKYDEKEEGEVRTLQEEVSIYTKKVENLQQENTILTENHRQQIELLNEKIDELTNEKKSIDKEALGKTIDELSKQLESYKQKCSELENSRAALDNQHAEEVGTLKSKILQLDKDLEHYRNQCNELDDINKRTEKGHLEVHENMLKEIKNLETELEEMRKDFSHLQEENANFKQNSQEIEQLRQRLQPSEQEQTHRSDNKVETSQMKLHQEDVKALSDKITELESTVEKWRNNCNELEDVKKELVTKHSEEKEDLISKIENQRILVEGHENNLQTVTNEKVQLEKNLKNVSEELQSSSQTFENFKTEKEAVIEEKNNVINELFGKIMKLQEHQNTSDSEDTKKLQEENVDLKNESKRLNMFLESLRDENNQLLDEMQSSTGKHKQKLKEVDEELTSLKTEKGKLSKDIDRVKERYELLIVDLKDEIENQKKSLQELEVSNGQYVQEIANLVEEMERRKNQQPSNIDPDTSGSSEENSFITLDEQKEIPHTDESTQRLYDDIAELKAQNEQFRGLVQELEDEGQNKFGVLLSQHEKELEVLKEELEDQIARKREQLAQEAATKRQKLKEEYESKLRVIYDELVSEKTRSKEHIQQINQLGQKVNLLEGINSKHKKDAERMKVMEEKVKELERQARKKEEDSERDDDVKTNIKILEDKLLELRDKLVKTESTLKEKVQELTRANEKIKSLEEQLDPIKPNKKEQKNTNIFEQVVSETAAEELQGAGSNGFIDSASEDKSQLGVRIVELENDKTELEKQLKEQSCRNEKLQKDLQNMDKAKQVVIQMYDEKVEALAFQLDDSSDRCDVLRKQFETTKKMMNRKEKEFDEKKKQFAALEAELKNEQDSTLKLKKKVGELEDQLVIEKGKAKTDSNESEGGSKDDLLHKLNNDLRTEKELNITLTKTIEDQVNEIKSREDKLVEITDLVTNKNTCIAEKDGRINEVTEELILEKKKSAELEKELVVFKGTDGTIVQRMEQMRIDLNEMHENNNQLLKENYESILSQKFEEHRVQTEEFEAEIVTLKGMVDNLEQLVQLKDEDREIQLKESEEKHATKLLECQEIFKTQKQELNESLLQITKDKHLQKAKLEELTVQVRALQEDHESQKKTYENEIKNLKKQIDFENSFQVELQEGFQTEMKSTVELQEHEHKRELDRVNVELQQSIKDLDETRTEHKLVLNELNSTKQSLEIRLQEIKNLEEGIIECKAKHEEDILELTKKMEDVSNNQEVLQYTSDDDLITSLRNDNKSLEDEVKRLNDIIQAKNVGRHEDIDLVKGELEKRFDEQQDEMNKRHTEELDILMLRLETLVHQESESKALITSHMDEINSIRDEMMHRVDELNNEKEQEVEAMKRRIENHYHSREKDLQENIDSKCKEVTELHNTLRLMKARTDQQQSTTDELYQLRRENADLYRKLREVSPGSATMKMVEMLKTENQNLKRENEHYKRILQRNTAGSSEPSGEGSGPLKLIKVMEQLMVERNNLEMKLREEILDLKTRFSPSGDINNSSSSNVSSFSDVNRDSLVNMLQELRSSKHQQEEDIQVHIREIEKMIDDIKRKIQSTEYADAKIQEMLAKQLHHLEEQRHLLVTRLWNLREKHDNIEQKLAKQIAALSTQASPDEVKSKLYQNLLEENLRKEKEQLLSKRQQVNDLRRRLSTEKALMDRRVAERQRLQQQLSEKDKQESELSTERYELEKRWRDRLRAKEMELKQEHFDMQQRSVDGYRDSVAARISGLISRSSDDLSAERNPQGYDYPRFNLESSSQPSLNRHYLQREAKTFSNRHEAGSSLTEFTHFRPYDAEKNPPTRHYQTRQRDSGFKLLPNEVPENEYLRNSPDHSSDDSSLALSNHFTDAVSIDMDDKFDSDIDSYTPPSRDRLTGMEREWERNLEEELNQISVGTLKILPSGKVNSGRDTGIETRKMMTRIQSDLSSRQYVPRYYQSPLEKSQDEYPRSSTAVPGENHEWSNRNGSMNLSQISTVLPTLLKDLTKGRDLQKSRPSPSLKESRTQGAQRLSFSPSIHSSPKEQPQTATSQNSSKSNKHSIDKKETKSQGDHSSVYLLNMDDYIDRHRVLSSDVVASLRDLSPSERYSHC